MQAMDSSHVALVSLLLKDEGFDHFQASRNQSLGVNLTQMAKIMSCSKDEDLLTLSARSTNPDELSFTFESPKQSRLSNFCLKLMDIDSEHLSIPDMDYSMVISMDSSEFQRICKEIALVGDTVKISTSKEGVRFSTKGDMGRGTILLKSGLGEGDDEEDEVVIEGTAKLDLTFSLRYLQLFVRGTTLSKRVTLKLAQDSPLCVEYPIPDKGYLRFYLAPKIEDEELAGESRGHKQGKAEAEGEGGEGEGASMDQDSQAMGMDDVVAMED